MATASLQPPIDVGSVIAGRYRLVNLIGEGSFARVFLAEQLNVGRKVAIKILQRDLDPTWDAVGRFQEEARLLATVRSPAVVQIHDIGRTPMNDPFIVMEYVDGRSLSSELKIRRRLDPGRAVHILQQILGALSEVHEAGVVHRDLKPGNIVLERGRMGRERVRILDFGLAKVVKALSEEGGHQTQPGLSVGTPQYMAPEQVDGSDIDARADLYAVGLLAYVMLTGVHPYAGSEDSTMRRRTSEDPLPLRQACPHATLPDSLERFVLRALARDPLARFQSADEMQAELATIAVAEGLGLHDVPERRAADRAVAAPPATTLRPRKGLHQREWLLVAAILFVVGILVGMMLVR